jgi:hypothetical protein
VLERKKKESQKRHYLGEILKRVRLDGVYLKGKWVSIKE